MLKECTTGSGPCSRQDEARLYLPVIFYDAHYGGPFLQHFLKSLGTARFSRDSDRINDSGSDIGKFIHKFSLPTHAHSSIERC